MSSALLVRTFEVNDTDAWDTLVRASWNGTFLHSRRFLSYHGERFADRSLVLEDERGRMVGAFPAAIDPSNSARIVSHPGITFGGLVHRGELRGEAMVTALIAIQGHYSQAGFSSLRYKAVPSHYHQVPSSDDLYALFRLGAQYVRCDLAAVIDLHHRQPPSERRRRSLKKALKFGLEIESGPHFLPELWEVLSANLANKYKSRPVHSLEEIRLLQERFPQEIQCVVATEYGQVVAGVVLFNSPMLFRAQYITSNDRGYEVSALDAVFDACIARAGSEGCRYFDFGTSNEQEGRILNQSLFQFKTEFGGGGAAHQYFDLSLVV